MCVPGNKVGSAPARSLNNEAMAASNTKRPRRR